MPTQAQIDLAKKYGYTQEQINQELATPGSVKRSAVLNPIPPAPTFDVGQQSTGTNAQGETIYNFGPITPTQAPTQPNYGDRMDTSTGLPEVIKPATQPKPTIATSWGVVGKQKDPASVSAYLNTQPGFSTSIVGNTVQGTKNGVQTTWEFNGTDWVAKDKPTIATSSEPVKTVDNATITKTNTDYKTLSPQDLRNYMIDIYAKNPADRTDTDKEAVRWVQGRMAYGETQDKIFGTSASSGTTTYSQQLNRSPDQFASSVKNADGTYTVTYKDGSTQVINEAPTKTVFPEGTPEYFAQKSYETAQAQVDNLTAQMNAEAERRKKETADLVAKYGENIASQFQSQKAEIEAQGAKRMDTLNSGLSFSGFGRSTLALDKRDEIAKNIETTINQAKAKADLELMAYRMEQEGADAEAISTMRKNIAQVQANIDQANYENQQKIIELNQQNATTGAEAMMNLLNTISNSEQIVSNADIEKSQALGYFVDKDGKIMLDSQKRPIQFEGTTSGLTPEQIQSYSDAIRSGVIKAEDLDKTLNASQKADILKNVGVMNGTYSGFSDLTSVVQRDVNGTKGNIGQDTNNPGNIMADSDAQKNYAKSLGAVGFYSSPNGRTYAVFSDMDTGYKAMLRDLQGKLSGGSSWATPQTTLGKLASGWVSGPNAPINSSAVSAYVKATGYPANTPIGQIPIDVLAKAIYQHEGVDITKSANIPIDYTGTGGAGGGLNISPAAQNIIQQINTSGGKPQDYILGTSADSQKLLQEVIAGLNSQGGTGTLATDTRKQSLDLAATTTKELLDKKYLAGAFRTRNEWTNTLGANQYTDFVNRVDALAGQLLQIDGPTLKAMFGPQISNSDVEAIKRTILQGLDPKNQTPAAFEKSLKDVQKKMQAYISRLSTGGANTGNMNHPGSTGTTATIPGI